MSRLINDKLNLPELTITYIFKVFTENLKNKILKENKALILDFLFRLDKDYFIRNIKVFFLVMDTNVRRLLLKKFENCKNSLDEVTESLGLGLRVRDKELKRMTIDFIFINCDNFNSKSFESLIVGMMFCKDGDSIDQICNHLMNMKRQDTHKAIYKLLESCIVTDNNSIMILKCIDKFFIYFELVKITQVILPHLCERLVDKNLQEHCFVLVEKIIKFLKENREGINSKDWSLKGLKNIFYKNDCKDLSSQSCGKDSKDFEEWD